FALYWQPFVSFIIIQSPAEIIKVFKVIYVLNSNTDGNCSGTYLNYRSWNVIHTVHFLNRTSIRYAP
ncbi:hypothetical protein C0J52_22793, partial [Blattella germanica]